MDQEQIAEMARVYMTDPGCRTAVERYRAEHEGISVELAAQVVAKTIRPAPHNVEAADARYLLAPHTEAEDDALLDQDEYLKWATLHQQHEDPPEQGNEGIGPMPPHADEALDDRVAISHSVKMTAEEFELFEGSRGAEIERHHCSLGCKLLVEFARKLDEAERIPVSAPVLHIRKEGDKGAQRVRISAECVPARRRECYIEISFGEKEEVDTEVEKILEALESPDRLSYRLTVRRSKRYALHIIYRPVEEYVGFGIVPQGEDLAEMLANMFNIPGSLIEQITTSGPGIYVVDSDGLQVQVIQDEMQALLDASENGA